MKTQPEFSRQLARLAVLSTLTIVALFYGFAPNARAGTVFVTNTNDNGSGSLRSAVDEANMGIADTIAFNQTNLFTTPQTITLTSGPLIITSAVAIDGPGANLLTVNGNAAGSVFVINSGTVTISGMTITNGSASYGGGLYNVSTLTVTHCAITNNRAGVGGGIFNDGGTILGGTGSATLTVSNSTFSANSGFSAGGAIFSYGGGGSASAEIFNSTFSGNSSLEGYGMIYNEGSDGSSGFADLQVINCTFSGSNFGSTAFGSAIYNDNTGLAGIATVEIGNTIFNVGVTSTNAAVRGNDTITSLGYNLSSDDSSEFLNQTTDQNNTDPMLGPLQNNGGTTPTHALSAGSPAIDKGEDNPGGTATNQDQRGYTRSINFLALTTPPGDRSDIGAYEVQKADLNLGMGVNKVTAKGNTSLTYTIAISNLGPGAASNVVVTDMVPAGTAFASASANRGNVTTPTVGATTGTVTWTLGDVLSSDPTALATIRVTVVVKSKTTITNTAKVTTSTFDPNTNNNMATINTSTKGK